MQIGGGGGGVAWPTFSITVEEAMRLPTEEFEIIVEYIEDIRRKLEKK